MDPKEIFDRRARRGVGPMETAARAPGLLDSVNDVVFERAPLPILDPLPRILEFQRKSESWFGFPYHCLMNIEYQPHERLVLTFSTHEVVILGRNLKHLYDEIVSHKCACVVEMDRATALAASAADAEVNRILIEEVGARHARKRFALKTPAP